MAKPKPMINLLSKTVERSPTMPSSSTSGSPETLKARNQSLVSSTGKPVAGDSNENTSSRSQARQWNANLDRSIGKPIATGKTRKIKGKNWPHNFQISDREKLEKIFPNLRQNIGRKQGDDMLDTNGNSLIWRILMSATMNAAVHLGRNYEDNLRPIKNTKGKKVRQLFDVTQTLIEQQEEGISGTSTIDWWTSPWDRATLLNDRQVQLSTPKVYVVSDSVHCLGKVPHPKDAVDAWKTKIDWFTNSPQYRELHQIDGEPMVFEWKFFQAHTTMQILEEIQKMMAEMKCGT